MPFEVSSVQVDGGSEFQDEFEQACEVLVKRNIGATRIDKALNMNEAAALLKFSRKQLEDLETVRNYGSFIKLNMLAEMAKIYDKPIEYFLQEHR